MRGVRFERQVAEFVDDEQLRLGEMRQPLLEPPVGLRLGQVRDQRHRAGEQHRIASDNRFAAERHGQMRLADARRTEQQQRVAVGDEASGGELADLRLVERGLGGEVEAGQVAHERERAPGRSSCRCGAGPSGRSRARRATPARRASSAPSAPLRRGGCRADPAPRSASAASASDPGRPASCGLITRLLRPRPRTRPAAAAAPVSPSPHRLPRRLAGPPGRLRQRPRRSGCGR